MNKRNLNLSGAYLLAALAWVSTFALIWLMIFAVVELEVLNILALFFFFLVAVVATAVASPSKREG